MRLFSWLRKRVGADVPAPLARWRKLKTRPALRARPQMEVLEDRIVPASLGDSLYIGDGIDNSVKQFDAATGAYQGTFVAPYSAQGPRGIIFGQGHNLLMADQRNAFSNIPFPGDVLAFDGQTGAFLDVF